MLLLFFSGSLGPAPSAGYVNASVLVQNIWPPLNAVSAADAVFWSEAEIFEWFNEAGRKLAGSGGAFVQRDTSLSSSSGIATYVLPAAHQATIQADLAGLVLRPRNVQELEALDEAWPITSGAPVAFLLDDAGGVTAITLSPLPDTLTGTKTIGLVMRAAPSSVTAAMGFLVAPQAFSEYFTFYILGEARAKETRAQMPEISAWFRQLCGQLEQAINVYMGEM